ncbi:sigma-E processing peptidase SpoIIGA [Clostridium hydrogenum]|uniref:sigma-E processing peptidase SpoIIGA n=1 Tax=Clostridium hydrogenum TaxID=2855764 RepID=UPI001F362282|nr:sigma-E processing peptidase SpoIIGA [Clostridium hydrogenum]
MVVFLDVLIFENVIVNTFLLHITAQTLMIKVKLKRLFISGAIGGIYVITLVFPQLSFFSGIVFKIIVAVLMVYIAFKNKNVLFNIKATVILTIYSMALAGICLFIDFYMHGNSKYSIWINNIPYEYVMISIMILYMVIYRITVFVKDRRDVFSLVYNVEIGINDKQKFVRAFFDTGNELREPVTNLPVMIVERSSFEDIVMNEKGKYYIQYQVASGKPGILEAFKPTYVKIYNGTQVEMRDMIIALSDNKLSNFNEYTALLPRGCI